MQVLGPFKKVPGVPEKGMNAVDLDVVLFSLSTSVDWSELEISLLIHIEKLLLEKAPEYNEKQERYYI